MSTTTTAVLSILPSSRRTMPAAAPQAAGAKLGQSLRAVRQSPRFASLRHEVAVTLFDLGLMFAAVLLLAAL